MNDLAPILKRIAAINPVPDETDLPGNATVTSALLDGIDERIGSMQTQQIEQGESRGTHGFGGRVSVAVAAFALVIVAGGVIAFIGGQTQDAASSSAVVVIAYDDHVSRYAPETMANAIQKGAMLTVDRDAYLSDLPERLDIVMYESPRTGESGPSVQYVSRVIGLPGETVEYREGVVYVNGATIDEPYLKNPEIANPYFPTITLGTGEFYLMGDNRQGTGDSLVRGAIPITLFQGKVIEIANP